MQWKPIQHKEIRPLYEVSDTGLVRLMNENVLCNLIKIKNGYYTVKLKTLAGPSKSYYVHRLVCAAFVENPENKPYIDHINTIKTDNTVNNLRWATAKENANNSLTKKHNAEAQVAHATDPAFIQKQRERALLQWQDPEMHEKQRLATVRRWNREEERTAQSKRIADYFSKPDNRQKAAKAAAGRSKKCQCLETGQYFDSLSMAATQLGLYQTSIRRSCNTAGQQTAGGLHFIYQTS